MAVQYVTLDNLGRAMQRYDTIFKLYTDDQIKKYLHAIVFDDETRLLKFYDVPAPVPAGTEPFLSVEIPMPADDLDAKFDISMEVASIPDQGKYKTVVFYQGTGDHKQEVGRFSVDYDTVVQGGVTVIATPQNPIIIDGQQVTSGQYLKLTIANQDDPVYISLSDIGVRYEDGNGINITNNAISLDIDSNNANGLAVTNNGLKLDLAVAADAEHGIAGSAGAMSAEDKAILSNFSIASESQIRELFNND